MKNMGRVLTTCILSVVLVFLFLSFTGCERKSNDFNQEEVSSIIENTQGNLKQLEIERDKIMKKIKEAEKVRSMNPMKSEKESEENIKKLEALSEDLLERSKEIEEKIKTLQQNKN